MYGRDFKFNFLQISQKPPELIYYQDIKSMAQGITMLSKE